MVKLECLSLAIFSGKSDICESGAYPVKPINVPQSMSRLVLLANIREAWIFLDANTPAYINPGEEKSFIS